MAAKNLITWKDADQNLCTVAAYMLSEASKALRSTRPQGGQYLATDGEVIFPGFAEDGGNRTVFSGKYDPWALLPGDAWALQPCPQCWWCFQNIITNNLKKARAELAANLYPQSKRLRVSKQLSRNPWGRSKTSKYGRVPER